MVPSSTPVRHVMPQAPLPENLGPQARVINSLKQLMSDGVLTAGSPVPPERVLSEQFNVNRGTVRRALQVLQDEGFLRTQNGKTRIITERHRPRGGVMQYTVAVLQPTYSQSIQNHHQSGWLEYIGRGTMKAIQQLGKHVISLHPERLGAEEIEQIALDQPFGVIITDLKRGIDETVKLASQFQQAGLPVVVYGDAPELADFDRVGSDHESGAYELTKWLISQGRRRIAFSWTKPTDRYWYAQRLIGYRRAMDEAGLEVLSPIGTAPFPATDGDPAAYEAGARGLVGYLVEHLIGPNAVDALMAGTDSDTFGLAAACRLCGKIPGQDVLITGYDNYWIDDAQRALEPATPAATVDKRNECIGEELVHLLRDRVNGELNGEPVRRVVAPKIVLVGQQS